MIENRFINMHETLGLFPEVQEHLQRKAQLSSEIRKIRRRLRTLQKEYAFLKIMLETKDSHEFEVMVAKFFRKVGYTKVVHTGQSGREDVQVWIENRVYRIECKNVQGNAGRGDIGQLEYQKKVFGNLPEFAGYEQKLILVINNQNQKALGKRAPNPLAKQLELLLVEDQNGLVSTKELFLGFIKLKKGEITFDQFDKCLNKIGLIEF